MSSTYFLREDIFSFYLTISFPIIIIEIIDYVFDFDFAISIDFTIVIILVRPIIELHYLFT